MFWVVDNFLMLHKKKNVKPKEENLVKVKYQKASDGNASEEAVVLLDNEIEEDYILDEVPYNGREHLIRR